ncbi:MAG: hypothetical protein RIQ52_761 [Pseudomonadota bacterium]
MMIWQRWIAVGNYCLCCRRSESMPLSRFWMRWVLIGLLLGAVLWAFTVLRTPQAPVQGTAAAAMPERRFKVLLAPVSSAAVNDSLTAVGTLAADESVLVKPEYPGRIDHIGFTEGQAVSRGTELFHLNADEQRASLAQSRAELELARNNYQRAQLMYERRHIALQDFEETFSKMRFAEATVEKNRIILEKMSIRAPFAGVMGLRQVSMGDYVDKGQALVNLESIHPLKLDFRVPEKYLPLVRAGQPVTVSVSAFPGETFTGEITAMDPKLDEASRTLKVRAQLPNPDDQLHPGMFASVVLVPDSLRQGLWIPEAALVVKGSTASVFRYLDGRVHLVMIQTGLRQHGQVEVLSGLAEGDQVVVEGHARLRENAAVDILQGGGG